MSANPEIKNIVLVHGGFVDGSGWQGVYDHLTADGYRVSVVQNPTLSLAGDVAATHMILDGIDGPAVLVGHSYGGNPPPAAPVPPILPPRDGFLFLDRDKFAASFAGDVAPALAAFMADSQVPWGVDALGGAISEPAWRSKPSWYLLVTDDRMIDGSMIQGVKGDLRPGTSAVVVLSSDGEVEAIVHAFEGQPMELIRSDLSVPGRSAAAGRGTGRAAPTGRAAVITAA